MSFKPENNKQQNKNEEKWISKKAFSILLTILQQTEFIVADYSPKIVRTIIDLICKFAIVNELSFSDVSKFVLCLDSLSVRDFECWKNISDWISLFGNEWIENGLNEQHSEIIISIKSMTDREKEKKITHTHTHTQTNKQTNKQTNQISLPPLLKI